MENVSWPDKVTSEEDLRAKMKTAKYTELYSAKETSMDWPCLRHDGLLNEIVEGVMRSRPERWTGGEEFK